MGGSPRNSKIANHLETRTDFDMNRVGFYGISWGGGRGAQIPAVEDRLKLNILVHGGFRSEPYEASRGSDKLFNPREDSHLDAQRQV